MSTQIEPPLLDVQNLGVTFKTPARTVNAVCATGTSVPSERRSREKLNNTNGKAELFRTSTGTARQKPAKAIRL